MFVQIIQGRAKDAAGLRKQMERWQQDLAPGATGFLGATAGVADDGEFIALARFESEEAARRNSDRPEQGEWWAETAKYLEGEPTFHDCTEVDTLLRGGSDDAGFVQVIQGRATDENRLRETLAQGESRLPEVRPDLIGGITARHDDGSFTEVAYFTSETAAREGEKRMEQEGDGPEWQSLVTDIRFIDLRDPWLYSP